ncbi:MAG TPA: hypothetical protein VJ860_02905, partial [Polyangia bacterium]|nr:hypothetical protein [Polyangia bacterium]
MAATRARCIGANPGWGAAATCRCSHHHRRAGSCACHLFRTLERTDNDDHRHRSTCVWHRGRGGGLYRPWRTGTILAESKDALIAWLAVPVVLFAFWFFTKTASHYSRIASFAWFAFTPLFFCAVRIGARTFMRILRIRGRDIRRVGILGCTKDAERLTDAFETMPWLGLKLAGVYDDRADDRRDLINHPHWSVIGRFDDLVRDCHEGKLDAVYVALPLRAEARTAEILAALADTTATVYLLADLLYCSLLRAQWGQVAGVPVVSLHDSPFQGIVGWIKRIEDLVLGSF